MAYYTITQYNNNADFKIQIKQWTGSLPIYGFAYTARRATTGTNFSPTSTGELYATFEGLDSGLYLITVKALWVGYTSQISPGGGSSNGVTVEGGSSPPLPTGDSFFTLSTNQGKINVSVQNNSGYIEFFYLIYHDQPNQGSYPDFTNYLSEPGHSGFSSQTSYQFSNLLPTNYWVGVAGRTSVNGDWEPCYYMISSSEGEWYHKIRVSGSSGTQPSCTVSEVEDNKIQVIIKDNSSGFIIGKKCRITFNGETKEQTNISSDPFPWTSETLSAGTYNVVVQYQETNGYWATLTRQTITISGGGSGGNKWKYLDINTYTINISSDISSIDGNVFWSQARSGFKFIFNFDVAGTLNISVSNATENLYIYIGSQDNGYEETNGQPGSWFDDFYTKSFSISYQREKNKSLYVWINTDEGDNYQYQLNVSFEPSSQPPPSTPPDYTYSVNGNYINFRVSNPGTYYLSYIIRLNSDPNDPNAFKRDYVKDTEVTLGPLLNDIQYALNVGYSTGEQTARTWIRKELITIKSSTPSSGDGYVYIYDGSQWRKAIPYIYDGTSWRKAIPYIYDGSKWRKCIK